ncbi:MAG: hypothetical protein N2A40_08115, partial [Desulfobulbaceae bacterium]
GPEYGELVKLLSEIRNRTLDRRSSQEHHKLLVEKILQTNVLALLKNKEWQELQTHLLEILPADMNVNEIVQKVREE